MDRQGPIRFVKLILLDGARTNLRSGPDAEVSLSMALLYASAHLGAFITRHGKFLWRRHKNIMISPKQALDITLLSKSKATSL